MAELPGLEHDPAEWMALGERHRNQNEALARFLFLISGIARNFDRLQSEIGTLHCGVRELARQQGTFGERGITGR